MSEIGSPPRRPNAARPALLGLVVVVGLGGVAWYAFRSGNGAPAAPSALPPRVTDAATAPVPVTPPPAARTEADVTAAPAAAAAGGGQDTTAPAKPAPEQRPSFDIVRVSPAGSAVVAGRAAPHAEVALLDNGQEIARGKADDSGQFVVIPDKPLPAGGQELALQSEQPGQAPVQGDTPALLVVPERKDGSAGATAPAAPAKDVVAAADATPARDGAPPSGAVAVLAPPDAAPRLLAVPAGPAGAAKGQVALRVVDYDAHGDIRFAGTAAPGATVRLYIDNQAVGDTVADAAGNWGMVPDRPVQAGDHRLRADEVGARGQVMSRAELPFQRAAFTADTPREGQVVVQPRQSLWRIARHVYGQGVRYTLIYEANRDQIRNPDLIYPGQIFALPAAK